MFGKDNIKGILLFMAEHCSPLKENKLYGIIKQLSYMKF